MPAHRRGPSPAYLSSIAYSLGRPVALRDCDDPAVRRAAARLAEEGITHARERVPDLVQLAISAGRQTLLGAGAPPVDAVVYCTDSPIGNGLLEAMPRFLTGVGQPGVPAVGIAGNMCANLTPALDTAAGLLADGRAACVLIATADCAQPVRFQEAILTVESDGAATFLVTNAPRPASFLIETTAMACNAEAVEEQSRPRRAKETFRGVRRVVGEVLADAGLKPSDCRYLVTANYGRTVRDFLVKAAGMAPEQLRAPRAAGMGHSFTADILVNLDCVLSEPGLRDGDVLILLGTSPYSWSAVLGTVAKPARDGRIGYSSA